LIISIGLYFCSKKYIKKEKTKNLVLLLSAILTIVCHYSTFIYLNITNGATIQYLKENPNLLLPIYPCNVVMWGCLIYGIMKNKESKGAMFLADYLFWFGIFSTLVGMFANVDFINNPTFKDYEVTKSIVAHATLLFNMYKCDSKKILELVNKVLSHEMTTREMLDSLGLLRQDKNSTFDSVFEDIKKCVKKV
jgi:hypothetical protein